MGIDKNMKKKKIKGWAVICSKEVSVQAFTRKERAKLVQSGLN